MVYANAMQSLQCQFDKLAMRKYPNPNYWLRYFENIIKLTQNGIQSEIKYKLNRLTSAFMRTFQ